MGLSKNDYPILSDVVSLLPDVSKVPASTILIEQGERPKNVCLLLTGIVKLGSIDSSGNEFFLGLRSGGWWLNAESAILGVPSMCRVSTLSPCSLTQVFADDFLALLNKSPIIERHVLMSKFEDNARFLHYAALNNRTLADRMGYALGHPSRALWGGSDQHEKSAIERVASLLKDGLKNL